MNTQEALISAFEQHLRGDAASALAGYQAVLSTDPSSLFAQVLINLVNLQWSRSRSTKRAGLDTLRHAGFVPATVIDVGAQVGTPPLYEAFPEAHHLMLEPVQEHEAVLKAICSSLKSAECVMAAVSSRSGTATLSLTESLQYASIEAQLGPVGNNRVVPMVSLNDLCGQRNYVGPFLVKIDVDGIEIEVLKGATTLLAPENVFVIEASMLDEQPRFLRILEFFRPFGFVLHDIVDALYRPTDRALWQVDVILVHDSHPMRAHRHFV